MKKPMTIALMLIMFLTVAYVQADLSQVETHKPEVPSIPPPDYQLGPNDILSIEFYNNAELSKEAVVLPDGNISYPLIGTVYVKGKTVTEAAEVIRQKFLKYFKKPMISVSLSQYYHYYSDVQKSKIGVIGEVNRPGTYAYSERIRLSKYLADAGGLTDDAGFECTVIRQEEENYQPIQINLKKILQGQDRSEDIIILENDMIYIPKSQTSKLGIKSWYDTWHFLGTISTALTIILLSRQL